MAGNEHQGSDGRADAVGASRRGEVLAIVAPDLFHASVTFFHEHIRSIWPRRTVVIHLSSTGEHASLDVPTLELPMRQAWPEPKVPLIGKVVRQANAWRASTLTDKQERRVATFLRRHGVTHLLAEFATSGLTIAPVARRLGMPFAVMCHGWDVNVMGQSRQFRTRYRTLYRPDVQLIANGPFLRDRLGRIGAPLEHIRIVPCAVDARPFPLVDHTRHQPCRAIMVARLIPWKGALLSLEAFALAAEQRPTLELDIIGDGPQMAELQSAIEARQLCGRVRVRGALTHAETLRLIGGSHVFLQHCVTIPGQSIETQGVSLLEAMGHGVVPIVTRHGAMEYQVEDGARGWLVNEGDVAAMAERIVAMTDDPAARTRLGLMARRFVLDNFAPEEVHPQMREAIGLPPRC